ncbi:MAG: hypothetical protein ABSD73_01370 [Candidatus Bathyarchaeia archaeon]
MNLNDYFPKDEVEDAKYIIHEFHDKLLLDDKPSDKTALLLSLYMCSNKNKQSEITYGEVRKLFVTLGRKEDNFAVNLFNAKREELVDERQEGRAKLLSLKVKGLKEVKDTLGETIGVKTWLIESGKVYSGKKLFQEIVMSKIGSAAKICDPYCGTRILELISGIEHKCAIFLLTQAIEQKESFKRELIDFSKEFQHLKIEVRIFNGKTLHDRYIISDGNCWSVGSSLKDFGNKDTTLTKLEDEVRYAVEEMFDKRWQEATPFP